MKILLASIVAIAVSGCATNYNEYVTAQVKIAEANALTAKYKYEAMASLGNGGGDAAKVAAIMSMNVSGTSAQSVSQLQAPKTVAEQTLQWASVLLPSLTQMYSIKASKETSLAQINASTQTQMHQADSYVQFGTLINDPTIVTQPTPIVVNQPTPIVVRPEVVQPIVVRTGM